MDDAPHILIVDDDTRIRDLLQAYLQRQGFRVTAAGSAAEAREKMRALIFDAMVLDIMMPGESGLELTRSLRAAGPGGRAMPILLLSALAETDDRIRGLAAGSDDYMSKPFAPEELLLRLKALLRRQERAAPPAGPVRFGDCTFDTDSGELRCGGRCVRLTGREREILRALAAAGGRPLPREALMPPGSGESSRAVDVQINRLRRKIEADPSRPRFLRTVRGEGYALVTGVPDSGGGTGP